MAKVIDLFGQEIPSGEGMETKLSAAARERAGELSYLKLDTLRSIYGALTGRRNIKGPKAVVVEALAELLDFGTRERFDAFFATLPPLLAEAIEIAAFEPYIDVAPLVKKYGAELVLKTKEYGYYYEISPNPAVRADLFLAADERTLFLAPPIRSVFAEWLPKPDGFSPKPTEDAVGNVWSNADAVRESILLMAAASAEALKGMGDSEAARKGLAKTAQKKARAACGQAAFAVAGAYGLDSIDLFARTASCLADVPLNRVKDGDAFIKNLTQRFFSGAPKDRSYSYRPNGGYLEYFVLLDHLVRRQGAGVNEALRLPTSRVAFRKALEDIAVGGSWYSVGALYRSISMRGESFSFCDPYTETEGLRLKGDQLRLDDRVLESDSYEPFFQPSGRLRAPILELPLFKAYCYLMAVLGIVDISEAEPEKPLTKNGAQCPISPYDALRYIRVTAFGGWCLGITESKPDLKIAAYEAVADKELLLVTFKGRSLERKLYLEAIGDKLGTERYRITEASFIRGCDSAAGISERVEKFKKLIDAEPSPRWERFFSSVLSRVALFTAAEPAFLFSLPADPAVARLFVEDPRLRSIIVRAEGNRIAVRLNDHRKFLKLLAEHGFFNPGA